VRNRLLAEVALHTGLRRDEVRHLTVGQIRELARSVESKPSNVVVFLSLDRTKGQYPGKAMFPVWLVKALDWYRVNERPKPLQANASYDSDSLFVNHPGRRNAGGPISNDTISSVFLRAIVQTGLTFTFNRPDPLSGENRQFVEARHTYHDLRHTFAALIYRSQIAQGVQSPWLMVQKLLRHRSLSTTLETYLSVFSVDEPTVTDEIARYYTELLKYVR